ncbi:MAG TPA: serine/threonine-protein kinase [Kofleriaceae bacterium]|nr:serine/threonine-protein kinase [Kofleriaceae bacterium]
MAGKYEILMKLAEGGMAEVLLVRVRGGGSFEKYAVMKRLLPHLALDPAVRAMFLDEARIAGQLQHDNIAQVFDSGEAGGALFMVMEYLHGEDLRGLLRRTRELDEEGLRLEVALAIAAAAARGLHHAHEQVDVDGAPLHLVHRDVSSSNLFVTFSGGVKVVDFGIAFAARRSSETRTGTIKGKVAYMAPEQCLGRALDRRTDLWGLGVVLHELVAGQRPFDRATESDFEVMTRICEGAYRDPAEVAPGLPDEVAGLIRRCLTVAPEGRPPSAEAVSLEIEQIAERLGLSLSPRTVALEMERLFGRRVEPWVPWAGGGTGTRGPRLSAQATQVEPPSQAAAEASLWAGTTQAAAQPMGSGAHAERRAEPAPPTPAGSVTGRPPARSRRWLLAAAIALTLTALGMSIALLVRPPRSRAAADPAASADASAIATTAAAADTDAVAGSAAAGDSAALADADALAAADTAAAAGSTAPATADTARVDPSPPRPSRRAPPSPRPPPRPGRNDDTPETSPEPAPRPRAGDADACIAAARAQLESASARAGQLEQGARGVLFAARRDLEAARDLLGRGTPDLRCDPAAPHPDRTILRRELAVLEHRLESQERARQVVFRRRGRDLFFSDAQSGEDLSAAALDQR